MIMDLKGNCADKILYYSKNEEVIDNYYNAGGDMNYALQYSGNLFHELISNNSKIDSINLSVASRDYPGKLITL